MQITAEQILPKGLRHMDVSDEEMDSRSKESNEAEFKAHFGPAPRTATQIWNDTCTTNAEEAKLTKKEKSEKGLGEFLAALHFLWANPKNCKVLG